MDSDNSSVHLARTSAKVIFGAVHVLFMVFGMWIFTGGFRRLVKTITYKWDE